LKSLGSLTPRIWNEIAEQYNALLVTSVEEIHFGVGIPGNRTLGLVPAVATGRAIDLGCGAGENLVALSLLGYTVTGVDSSEVQLRAAEKLLKSKDVNPEAVLVCADMADSEWLPGDKFDLVLSVGAAHFHCDIDSVVRNCARLALTGAILVLSVPHPLDMLLDPVEMGPDRYLAVRSYYPDGNRVESAHYWRKFAGSLDLSRSLPEYLWRPSDVVNSLVAHGFRLDGIWEPQADDSSAPCRFRSVSDWLRETILRDVPQNLIFRATFGV